MTHSLRWLTHSDHSLTHSDHSLTHSDHSLRSLTQITHSNHSLRWLTHSDDSLTQMIHSLRSLTHSDHSLRSLTHSLTHSPTKFHTNSGQHSDPQPQQSVIHEAVPTHQTPLTRLAEPRRTAQNPHNLKPRPFTVTNKICSKWLRSVRHVHHTVQCGLAGERGTLIATPAQS